jgi:hypothetical protein
MPWRTAGHLPALTVGLALVCSAAMASPDTPSPSTRLSVEVGVGHENQSSPLFQLTPESTVLYLGGTQRLQGSHIRTNAEGMTDWALGNGLRLSLSGSATLKHSPDNPLFDMLLLNAQPSLHIPMSGSSLMIGLNLQRIDVSRQKFRQAQGLQSSWTVLDGNNFWSLMGEIGRQQHAGDFQFLNANTRTLLIQRHINKPVSWLEAINLSLLVAWEHNTQNHPDLSNRNAVFNAAAQWNAWGVDWSLARSWRLTRYEDTILPLEPMRRDKGSSTDLVASMPLSKHQTLQLEWNSARNQSITKLYDNQFRQLSITHRSSW